jgi:PIN domain nuclease of toxin-antitoxin system
MKLLLDTHAFLWLVEGNSRLGRKASTVVADPSNELFLSVASIWELAIKVGNGRLVLSEPLASFVSKWTATYQLSQMPVLSAHAVTVTTLAPHHRDPFDRLLIARALAEDMVLMSGDAKFMAYGVPILW